MIPTFDQLDKLKSFTPRAEREHLYYLANQVDADQAIVELGTYRGASACWLAAGAQSGYGAHVWTVDPHDLPGQRRPTGRNGGKTDYTNPAIRRHARQQIVSVGLADHITMVRQFSTVAGETWGGPPVGLLFIDGDHRQHAARQDFRAWEHHLAPGALVVWDDHADTHPGVVLAVAALVDKGAITPPEMLGRLAVTRPVRHRKEAA